MTRKVYTYWYEDKPLYHWCNENKVNYARCVEFLYKHPDKEIKDAIEYVKKTKGTGVKYSIDGISIRKRLGPEKYIKFTNRMEMSKKRKENKTWQEIYEEVSCL